MSVTGGDIDVVPQNGSAVSAVIPVGVDPFGIAPGAGSYVYVANTGSNNVSVLNASTDRSVGSVGVGSMPEGVAYDASNGLVYVTNFGSGNVSVLSGMKVVASVPVGVNPLGIAYDAATQQLLVANEGSGELSIISAAGGVVVANITDLTGPYAVAIDPSNGYAYVSEANANSVAIISLPADLFLTNIWLGPGGPAEGLAYNSGSGSIWVADGPIEVSVLSGTTLTGYFSVDPADVGYDPYNNQLCFANTANLTFECLLWSPSPTAATEVGFSETGLPGATNWTVDLSGRYGANLMAPSGSSITFEEYAGNYSYTVSTGSSNAGYWPSPARGTISIPTSPSSPVSVSISFSTTSTYGVSFAESGLPAGTTWSVTLNGSVASSSGGSISFAEPNGTYSFAVSAIPGYTASPSSGTIKVKGAALSVGITFRISATYIPGSGGSYVVFDQADGFVYILNNTGIQNSSVSVLRGSTVIATLLVPRCGTTEGVSPLNGYVYVGSDCGGATAVIGGANLVGYLPFSGVDFFVSDSGNGYMYMGNHSGYVHIVSNMTLVGTMLLSNGVFAGAYDASDGDVYLTGYVINVISGTRLLATFAAGTDGYSCTYDNSDEAIYVANEGSDNVSVIEGLSVLANVPVGSSPSNPVATPSGLVYLTTGTSTSGSVVVLNGTQRAATISVVASAQIGRTEPIYDPGDGVVYVVGLASANVTVIQTTSVTTTVNLGAQFSSGWASYDPENGGIYVPDMLPVSDSLAIIITPPAPTLALTFTESGLPVGAVWWVSLGGNQSRSSATTVTFSVPAGFYYYSVGYEPGVGSFSTTPSTGNLSVLAGAVTSQILFVPTTGGMYPVAFTETGLAAGASWSVTMINTTISTTGSSLTFGQANGTYSYVIGPVSGYTASPSSGAVTVAGAAISVLVTFSPQKPVFYAVTFSETGLPAGTSWSVVIVNVSSAQTTNSSLVLSEMNGSYTYTVGGVLGYVASPARGTFNVKGALVAVSIAFVARTYVVTFNESGLRAGTPWSVTVGGSIGSSTSSQISFPLANGTYSYTVAPVAGYTTGSLGAFTVGGASLVLSIRFVAIAYSVTFRESGLPAGANWTIRFSNQTFVGSSTSVVFSAPNGTYAYSIAGPAGYVASPSSGAVAVSGGPVALAITFTPPPLHAVTFVATGLPVGHAWAVVLRNSTGAPTTATTTNASLTLYVGSGAYFYNASSSGYPTRSGSFAVGNSTVTVTIRFALGEYSVTFTESGLANGTMWGLVFNGTSYTSTTSGLFLSAINGTYAFSVPAVSGYTRSPAAGLVSVRGTSAAIAVTFTPVAFNVTFTEGGLPSGTLWSVNLAGSTSNSTAPSIIYSLPNGTYAYSIGAVSGYSASPSSGRFVVSGGTSQISIVFSSTVTYAVSFVETGLPGGKLWSIQVNVTGGGSVSATTTNTSITLFEPPGVYAYGASSGGYHGSSGTFSIAGAAVTVSVAFSPASSVYAVTFNETGLPSGVRWSVSFGGSTWSTTSTGLVIFAINGTWNYSIAAPAGYSTSTPAGRVQVSGAAVTLSIVFFPSGSPVTYQVTFQSSGLPAGTRWTITVAGATYASSAASVVVDLGNGSYPYTLGPVAGYVASAWRGTFGVSGAPLTVALGFRAYLYAISVSETGLPSGTTWTVQVISASSSSFGASSQTTTLTLDLANGTYQLMVTVSNSSWQTVNQTVGLSVDGAAASLLVVFLYAYVATFQASGQASGTLWYVNLTGTIAAEEESARAGVVGLPVRYTFESALPTLRISLPNGSYTYSISSTDPRWVPSTAAGSLAVDGRSPPVVAVPGSPTSVTGLGAESYGLLTLGAAAIAIVALFAGREWYTRPPRKRGGVESKQLYGSYRVPRGPVLSPVPPGSGDDIL